MFNPTAEVSLVDSETIHLSWIDKVGEKEFNKKSTRQVFIEGCDYVCEDD